MNTVVPTGMEVSTPETFKIGDYVFVELQNSREPYWICKIEEIQKDGSLNTQIKVKLFYRRRHVAEHLLAVADKYMDSFLHHEDFDWELAEEPCYKPDYVKLHYKLLQRYLFVTKENLIISPSMIRGRCYVFLLTTVDSPMNVLTNENKFFFLLAYDSCKLEVHEDKGSIMLGPKYQAVLPEYRERAASERQDPREDRIWDSSRCDSDMYKKLGDITRSIHAYKCVAKSNPKLRPMLTNRDIHMFGSMEILHKVDYDLKATAVPILQDRVHSTDELDHWNRDEITIFERALYKYGKQFIHIRQEFLPWKSWQDMVRFYYHWKGTEQYRLWKNEYYSDQGGLKQLDVHVKVWVFPFLTGKESSSPKCGGCNKVPRCQERFSWGPPDTSVAICRPCSVSWKRYSGFPDSPALENQVWQTSSPGGGELPGSRLFKCETCSRGFKTKSSLQRHILITHGNLTERQNLFLCTEETLAARNCISVKNIRNIARRPFVSARSRN